MIQSEIVKAWLSPFCDKISFYFLKKKPEPETGYFDRGPKTREVVRADVANPNNKHRSDKSAICVYDKDLSSDEYRNVNFQALAHITKEHEGF